MINCRATLIPRAPTTTGGMVYGAFIKPSELDSGNFAFAPWLLNVASTVLTPWFKTVIIPAGKNIVSDTIKYFM